jgi:hypothetical protein
MFIVLREGQLGQCKVSANATGVLAISRLSYAPKDEYREIVRINGLTRDEMMRLVAMLSEVAYQLPWED